MLRSLFIAFQNRIDRATNTLRVRDGQVKFMGPNPNPVRAIIIEGTGRLQLSNHRLFVDGPIIDRSHGNGGIYHGNRKIPV